MSGAIPIEMTLAAARGDPLAQFDVGVKYLQGDGVSQDYKKALEWLGKAADQGHARALFNIGSMHLQGLGCEKNNREAMRLYEQAFEIADPPLLGAMADLVAAEHDRLNAWPFAFRCYRAAADAGHAESQVALGARFLSGQGVQQDAALGTHYIREAAKQGHPKALWLLAKIHAEGYDGEPNLPHAVFLFYCAALEGHPEAEKDGRSLEARLSPQQREEVRRRVAAMLERFRREGADVSHEQVT